MAVNNQKIANNTLALYLRMLLLMAVSLYTSRVILATLGVDDYGIYNLVGGFIALFSFISRALVSAIQRFFNVALGRGDKEEYKRIYSMGINIFIFFSIFLIIIGETVGLWFIRTQLNIPEGRETASFWVYQISLITLIVSLFRTPDHASIIAHEKMGFYAYISIFEGLLKLGIVYLLAWITMDKLILYVLLYLASTLLINLVYALYCRKHIPECKYCIIWDRDLFKRLVSFSGWSMVEGGARVFKTQGDSFFLNRYYSVAVNAAFGVAAQVYNAVNLFLTNFQTAFRPQLIQTYAAGELEEHYKLVFRSAKMSFFLLLLIVIPVAFNLDGLLSLWLKEVPNYTNGFCLIMLMAYLVDALRGPLEVSITANGNIKGIQVWSAALLLLGLFLGFIFLRSGASPYVVAVITFIVHFGFWCVFLYYARKLCQISIRVYTREVIWPVIITSVIALILPVVLSRVCLSGWKVILICIADLIWAGAAIAFVGFRKDERVFLFKLLCSRIIRSSRA